MFAMAKTTSINLRVSPEFRHAIEALAAYHGLSMSSYTHSLLVKAVRQETDGTPEAFQSKPERNLAPVIATISPATDPKDEIRRMVNQDEINEIERRLKNKGVPMATQSQGKMPAKIDETYTKAKRRSR